MKLTEGTRFSIKLEEFFADEGFDNTTIEVKGTVGHSLKDDLNIVDYFAYSLKALGYHDETIAEAFEAVASDLRTNRK